MPAGFALMARGATDEGATWRVRVEPSSPFFEGHFEGEPILPAVAQVFLFERLMAGVSEACGLAGIPSLRFRRVVRPGDVLDVAATPPDLRRQSRFDIRCEGERVSDGVVLWAASPEEAPPASPPAATGREGEKLAALLPHRGRALLVRRILRLADDEVDCEAVVPAASAFVDRLRAPACLGLEMAAQSAALLEATRRGGDGDPVVGYLVGVRDAAFETSTLAAEVPHVAHARSVAATGPLRIFEAKLSQGGASTLRATLTAWLPDA